jgi:hypothetical protein
MPISGEIFDHEQKRLKKNGALATAMIGLGIGVLLWVVLREDTTTPELASFAMGSLGGLIPWIAEVDHALWVLRTLRKAEKETIRVNESDLVAAIDRNNELLRLLRDEAPEFLERHEGIIERVSKSTDYLTVVVKMNSPADPPPAEDRAPGGE